jgi:hypothetical protein
MLVVGHVFSMADITLLAGLKFSEALGLVAADRRADIRSDTRYKSPTGIIGKK